MRQNCEHDVMKTSLLGIRVVEGAGSLAFMARQRLPEAGAAMLPTIECEGRRVGGMGGWGVGWSVGCGWSNSKAETHTNREFNRYECSYS